MTWWIWVLIGIALLAIEFASTTMHIGFFAGGALLVALLVGVGWDGPLWQQLLLFTATSLVALFFLRPIAMRKFRLNETRTVDSLIGEEARALDDIDVKSRGTAELRGSTWSAENVGQTPLKKGQRCTVARVDGLLLHIRAVGNQEISHG